MFGSNEKEWKQKTTDYRSELLAPETSEEMYARIESCNARAAAEREREKAALEFVSPEQKLKDWNLALVRIKQNEARLKEVSQLPTIEKCEENLKLAKDYLEDLRDRGYEPVKVVPINPSRVYVAPPEVAEAPEPVEEGPKKIPCPICGIKILETQGHHRLPELGEFVYCINDALKAKRSGLSAIVIEDNLERQAVALQNAKQ